MLDIRWINGIMAVSLAVAALAALTLFLGNSCPGQEFLPGTVARAAQIK